jgi:alpha-tubulin suppressor-like RCC1 family protein
LKSDGSIAAWGWNTYGQCSIPSPNNDFVAVAAGVGSHSLGLKSNGTIKAWGWNEYGQCSVPTPNTGFVSMAVGGGHSLGLKSDGSIVAWGRSLYGACSVPPPNKNFVAVSAGTMHSLGLKSDGSIVAWGRNTEGQCNLPSPNRGFVAIAGGGNHNLGLKSDGSVVAWGDNSFEQCTVPSPNSGFVAIAAGVYHSLGLKSDGTIVSWGSNTSGQSTVPAPNQDFSAVAAGSYHSLALVPEGFLQVTLAPDGSVATGAQWRLTNEAAGVWHDSGSGFFLYPGRDYTIEYKTIAGYEKPASQAVRIESGKLTSVTGVYQDIPTCSLTVTAEHGYLVTAPVRPDYPVDSTVTLYVGARQGYEFAGWTGDIPVGQEAANPLILTMNTTKTLTALFERTPSGGASRGIVAWGNNSYGQCTVPLPNSDFAAVAGGVTHSLGLKLDGSIVAWGKNTSGQCTVPAPNSGFVAIAGGQSHSLGLKSDGSIVAWGNNTSGQCAVPAPNSDFVAVSAGESHSLGLKSDGTVVAWGGNTYGQCALPSPNSHFIAIAAGQYQSLALKSDGSISTWGKIWNVSSSAYVAVTPPAPNRDFVAIAAGNSHSVGLKSDGSVVMWGDNTYNQCVAPSPNKDIVAIAGGSYYSLGLKFDGSVVVWGDLHSVPSPNRGFVALAGGGGHSLALKPTGTLQVLLSPSGAVTAGARWRLVGEGEGAWRSSETSITRVTGDYTVEFRDDLPGWSAPISQTVTVSENAWTTATAVYAAAQTWILPVEVKNGYALKSPLRTNYKDGTTVTLWAQPHMQGYRFEGWTGNIPENRRRENPLIFAITENTSLTATFSRDENGSVVAWGTNNDGFPQFPNPCDVPETNEGFVAVAGGEYHSLGLKADGSIVAWGVTTETMNNFGQCNVPSPNHDFVAVAAGWLHSLGLKSDGSIVAWGNSTVPTPNSGFVAVAGGYYHSLGLKSDGSIVAWGQNDEKQCNVPAPNRDFVAVAAGGYHSLGLKADGSIVAWGRNDLKQCDVPSPNRNFIAITAGLSFSLGLKSDGSIVAWGDNRAGQCTLPEPNRGFTAISSGSYHGLGMKADGSIVAWGAEGSLYDDGQCAVPAPNIGYTMLAAGKWHSLALLPSSYRLETPAAQGQILRNPDLAAYPRGTTVTLTAQPDAGYWLDHWMGDVPSGYEQVNPVVVTMDRNRTITMDLFASAQPPVPVVAKFSINNGADATPNRAVVLTNNCAGATSATVSAFMASESADFTTATWQPYAPLSLFTLSSGSGVKTVYFKVKDAAHAESAVTSDTISLGGDGSPVVAWGNNGSRQCNVPAPNTGFVAISAAYWHSLGLKSDGSIVAWGTDTFGVCSAIPAPNRDFVAVAAGYKHSLGLKSDGSIVAWGYGTSDPYNVPEPNRDFVAISAGSYFSLGLKSNGSIVAWPMGMAYYDYGQCNIPEPNSGFVAISAGGAHCLGLKTDGSVVAWGRNDSGECLVPQGSFVSISARGYHSLGLKSDGSILAWGDNTDGDFYDPRYIGQCDVPAPNSGFVAVSGGNLFSMGLKTDGSIVTWGLKRYNLAPVPTPNMGFAAIAAGSEHILALVNEGDLEVSLTPPEAIAAGARWRLTDEVKDVWHDTTVYDPVTKTTRKTLRSRVGVHTLTFKDVYGWNKPADQAVELTTTATAQAAGAYTRVNWSLSTSCTSGTIQAIPAGSSFPHGTTVTLTVQPDAGRWFDRWTGTVPAGWERVNPLVLTMDAAKTLTANLASGPPPAAPVLTAFKINNGAATAVNPTVTLVNTCTAVTSGSAAQYLASESPDFAGAVWQPYRSLAMFRVSEGDGVKTVYFKVKNSAEVESAVTSDTIAFAGSDLALVAWGDSQFGQCALPAFAGDFVAVSSGEKHNLGLKSDGTIVAWGDSYFNQCRIPSSNRDFVSVAAGRYHSLGLKKDGSVAAWGYNYSKQCTVPVPNSGFVAIAAGSGHSLGLKADGSIVAWGSNSQGQCSVPAPNSGFVAIAAGSIHSVGLKADGSVVAWGYNAYEQCTVPVPNSGFVAIAAGFYHSLGLKSDGTIVAWGANTDWKGNYRGQRDVPTPNNGFVGLAAAGYNSLGLRQNGSIAAWGANESGQMTIPSPNRDFLTLAAGTSHSLALAPGGDLRVTLTPPEAIAAGARWRLADEAAGVWHDDTVYDPVSNTSSTVLRARTGFHSLEFKELYGWTKPQGGEVELTTGGLTRSAGHYDPILRNLTTQCEGKGKILAVPAAFTGTQYVLGTTVTLTAQPDAGWRFSGWSSLGPSPAPTTNPFQLVMLADTTVTAHFTQVFTLTTSKEGQGTLEQNPSSTQVFDAGSTVTLTATPAAGYVFAGWSGGVAPEQKAQNPLVLVMDRNWSISAYFLPEGQSTVTLSVATEGQGSVRANPDLMFYPVDSTVTLTAVPGKGQRFVRWEGDVPAGSETAPTLTLTMTANKSVRAVFERIPSLPVWMISRADVEDLGENSLSRSICRVETQIERDFPWRGQAATSTVGIV